MNRQKYLRCSRRALASVVFCLSAMLPVLAPAQADAITFEAALEGLKKGSFKNKQEALEQLVTVRDERVLSVLQAMLDGRLHYRGAEKELVIVRGTAGGVAINSVVDGAALDAAVEPELKKVTVNNSLRKKLRGLIAGLTLSSDDRKIRLLAVKELRTRPDSVAADLLRAHLNKEKDAAVIAGINVVLALVDLQDGDRDRKIAAIEVLQDDFSAEVRNALRALVEVNGEGVPRESDAGVRDAAARAIAKIDSKVGFYRLLETGFFGLSLGSVLVLAAIGLAITFGVMGVINMAHGELIMLGAYTTYVVQQMMPGYIDYSLFVAIPLAFIVSGLFGIAIERGVIRFLYGRPLETLLATFGISLVLQQLVRSIFSPLNRSVSTPAWMSGSMEINTALVLTLNRVYILAFSLIVFALLYLILKQTRLGLQVRAVSQNRSMARAMGIRSEWVDAMTFGLGSGIAGVAGVALSQLTNVGPNLGQGYIIDSFMVVVFGGVGNLWGTLVGGLSLGVANKFLEPFAGAVLAKILVLVFIIIFIQKRPRGLFPQKGRAAEN